MSSSPGSVYSSGSLYSNSTSDYTPRRTPTSYPPTRSPQQDPQRPRLPSPRLFRDFFNAIHDSEGRRNATLPPANFRDTMQDVSRALRSANRALQNAQSAFESRSPNSTSEVVDLTNSPPDRSSESRFISSTTHPHDSHSRLPARPINTLNEPVYGPRTNTRPGHSADTADSLARARLRRMHNPPISLFPRLNGDRENRQQEEQAIQRQRENHSTWQRTQAQMEARNRENQQQHRATQTGSSHTTTPQIQSAESSPPQSPESDDPTIAAIDLTEVNDNNALEDALAKQRQDAIAQQKAQSSGNESGRTTLTAYKCPICIDTPKDATTTICGHLFCHRCIVDTLKYSEQQLRADGGRGRKVKGVCPVCRKPLDINDASGQRRTLVPLELKLMTRKRKREDKGKQRENDSTNSNNADGVEPREKLNHAKGKAPKREGTDDLLWRAFMRERSRSWNAEDDETLSR